MKINWEIYYQFYSAVSAIFIPFKKAHCHIRK